MKNYTYPRVTTSVTALPRSNVRPAPEDTTVLFVPIISVTGPANELVKIHSLEEYRSVFGIDLRLGRTLLNVSNWLTAGGTLYAYRLLNTGASKAVLADGVKDGDSTDEKITYFSATPKYKGSALNNWYITFTLSGTSIAVRISDDQHNARERFTVRAESETEINVGSKSEYLESIFVKIASDKFDIGEEADVATFTAQFSDGTDGWDSYEAALTYFWTPDSVEHPNPDLGNAIGNPLETPIDLIMDAGYSKAVKILMINAISSIDASDEVNALRPDIRGIFDLGNLNITIDEATIKTELFGGKESYKHTSNIFFYNQKITISEEAYFDEDMDVYPSYFLSRLIPANDLAYGIQFPTAGKRRGELEGVKKLSVNPDPDTKEQWFTARVNYIEKDSRGYYFMSQRTFDGSTDDKYDALSFINNSRVTCRMVNDLQRLGRDYLFEFNDAITLANMSSVLNRYVTGWISNRTLVFGNVEVSADPYSDEKVNAVLNIKFTNTIEVISVDLILY